MSLSKKIFIGSITVFVTLLLFLGIYNLSFKKTSAPTSDSLSEKNSDSQNSKEVPKNNSAKISGLTEEEVLAPILGEDGNSIKYYSKRNGKVFEIDFSGNISKTLSTRELIGLTDVSWSPDGSRAITKFSRPNNQFQYFFYDYKESKGTELKSNLDTVTWQNNSRIFYKYFDPKTNSRTLNLADSNGSNWTKVADLDYRFVSIAPVPRSALVSYWNRPDAFSETVLRTTQIIGSDRKIIFKGRFGADYLWSPDGNSLLISSTKEKGGTEIQLGATNDQGGEYRNLNMPTFVSKCVWSKDNKNVFCALPGSIPGGSVLPNDYNERKFNTIDTFWKIDTVSGKSERIVSTDQIKAECDATNLFLNLDESMLFFVNRIDGKLYKITL